MAKKITTVLAFFKITLKETFTYRGVLLLWLLGWLLSFLTMYFLWQTSAVNGRVGSFSLNELISYYFIGVCVVVLCGWYPFYAIHEMIKNGSVVHFLLKPVDFFWYALGFELGWHSVNTLLYLGFLSLIIFFLKNQLVFNLFWWQLPSFLLSLAMAALISLEVNLILASATFWLTKSEGLGSLFWMAIFLLGGQAVPLDFFPQRWQALVAVLPFRFMYSLPLEVYLNRGVILGLPLSLLLGFFWIIALYLIFKFSWRKGCQVYTAFGQ